MTLRKILATLVLACICSVASADYVSNSGIQGTGTISTLGYSHNTGTESNPVLWIVLFFSDSIAAVNSVQVDAVSATYVDRHQDPMATWGVEIWRMDGVTGTVDIDITLAAGAEMSSISVLTSDVDTVRAIGTAYQFVASGSDATIDVAPASETTDTVISFVSKNGSSTLTSNGTLVASNATSDFKAFSTHTAGSGTTSVVYTTADASATEVSLVALSLEATGGGGSNIPAIFRHLRRMKQ